MVEPDDRRPTASTAPQMIGDGGFQRLLIRERQQQERKIRRERFFSLAASITGMAVAVAGGLLAFKVDLSSRTADTLDGRIASLTQSLKQSASIISDIEQEVNQRQGLLEKLQKDADQARSLAALHSDQANAIVQALRGELDREANRGFWSNIMQQLIFALLGAIFGVAASEFWRRFWRRPTVSTPDDDNV